jgi:hypothetical protein
MDKRKRGTDANRINTPNNLVHGKGKSFFEFQVVEKIIPNFLLLVDVFRNGVNVGTCLMTYADWKDEQCLRDVAYTLLKGSQSHE